MAGVFGYPGVRCIWAFAAGKTKLGHRQEHTLGYDHGSRRARLAGYDS
jgi:hypothetical protein